MKPSQLRHFLPFRQLGLWLAGALREQETSMFRWFGLHAATATPKSRTGVTIVCVSGFMPLYVCNPTAVSALPTVKQSQQQAGKVNEQIKHNGLMEKPNGTLFPMIQFVSLHFSMMSFAGFDVINILWLALDAIK